jgi:class 3 adenylate cyclase
MGIHTGFCTVGNFGSESRMDYTIVGGTVNVASRLQTHATPGEILISFETFAHVKEHIRCEERGPVEVKGLTHPIATYQVTNTFEDLKRERYHFREELPALMVEIKLDQMTQEDRSRAEQILRQALKLFS